MSACASFAREATKKLGRTGALLASLLTAASLPAQNPPAAAVWVADHKALKRLDPEINQLVVSVSLAHEPEALAADPKDGGVWALAHKALIRCDRAGNRLQAIALKPFPAKLEEPRLLALNPYDGSLWIGDERAIVHLSAEGEVLLDWAPPDVPQALALDLDESLWLLTQKQLLHLSPQGVLLHRLELKPYLHDPRHFAIDALARRAWVAGKHALLQFDLLQPDRPPKRIDVPGLVPPDPNKEKDDEEDEGREKLTALAVHPYSGTLWLTTRSALLLYDRQGALLRTVDLKALGLDKPESLAFEPVTGSLWLGAKRALYRFTSDGAFIAAVALDKEAEVLSASAFRLDPTLSLLEPADGTLTNNPRALIRLGLGATCAAVPCLLPPAYYDGLSLDVELNAQAIGSRFSRSGTEASYLPPTRLPEGTNTLTAQARDLFGHRSNPISSRFTVDTIPPKFLDTSPPDGSVLARAVQTISGTVDDARATVVLSGPSGTSTSTGSAFRFAVTLNEGPNNFTLTATDPAGNATQLAYRLTLDTIPPPVPNLALISMSRMANGQVAITGRPGAIEAGAKVRITNLRTGETVTATAGADGSFTASLAAAPGDRFILVARDMAGNESRADFHPASATVNYPLPGATVDSDRVLVSGSVLGPPNTGVTVNGIVACADGDQFYATNVPLRTGDNTIAVTAITLDGAITTQTLNVTSSGPQPVALNADRTCAIAPERVTFSIAANTAIPINSVRLDFGDDSRACVTKGVGEALYGEEAPFPGDGEGCRVVSDPTAPIQHTYTTPGVYVAVGTVTDDLGNVYTAEQTIVVRDVQVLNGTLRSVYDLMLERLGQKNIESALNTITGGRREDFKAVFEALQPRLGTIIPQLGTVQNVRLSEDFAEYTIVREKAGRRQAYYIYLLRGEDGVWRIDGM